MHSHTPPIYPSARSLLPERRLWSSPRAGEDSSRFGRPGRPGHRGTSWDARPISATTTLYRGRVWGKEGSEWERAQQDTSQSFPLCSPRVPSRPMACSAKTDEISDPGCWCVAEPKFPVDKPSCASPKKGRYAGRGTTAAMAGMGGGGWRREGVVEMRSSCKKRCTQAPRCNSNPAAKPSWRPRLD